MKTARRSVNGHTVQEARHVFADSGVPPDPLDEDSHRWCRCGLRDDHAFHDLPAVSADEQELEARLMGEGGDHGR